jgi:DNA-binding PadR family transcriptional regulator
MTEGAGGSWAGLSGLSKLLEHRVRLGICVLLSRHESLNFSRLKVLLEETDGSLGAHLRKLEDAGFVKVKKTFQDRKPVSWYKITPPGARELSAHVSALEKLIRGEER